MPNQRVQEQVEKGELIRAIDLTRAPDDPHKLTPLLLALTVPQMPDHATYIRAYRQPLGGGPESAGVSNTTNVSVVQSTPPHPGATYEFWLVGVNSAGEGPESNHVLHTVAMGPGGP